jgi:hypothetical protein
MFSAVPPDARGGSRSSRTRGGMRWTRQRRARYGDCRADFGAKSCERSIGARTNGAVASLSATFRWFVHKASNPAVDEEVRGRQSRVVLAPVAGVKSVKVLLTQPGRQGRQFADDGGKTNSSPGRARYKPLKPFAQGRPGLSRLNLWSRPVHSFCTGAAGASRHPAFPAPSVCRGRGHPA